MRALVTGAAGFIGSHLCEELLARGYQVVGIDNFDNYYDERIKQDNIKSSKTYPSFTFLNENLLAVELAPLLEQIQLVFHLAGQPGVRLSWGEEFDAYARANILVTQKLLEAARKVDLTRFIYSSSSSVYGDAPSYPTYEDFLPQPMSPYGVTKLAAEHLCSLYARTWGIPTISLRYFTVYGPRQRPDMAFNRLVDTALSGGKFPVFGDGLQIRDFTYVSDVVKANLLAAGSLATPGEVLNIAGGGSISLLEIVDLLREIAGTMIQVEHLAPQPGDVRRTGGAIEKAYEVLQWAPEVSVEVGLKAQYDAARAAIGGLGKEST
jgi:nucleoside-diphosphate-sugar epimerase